LDESTKDPLDDEEVGPRFRKEEVEKVVEEMKNGEFET